MAVSLFMLNNITYDIVETTPVKQYISIFEDFSNIIPSVYDFFIPKSPFPLNKHWYTTVPCLISKKDKNYYYVKFYDMEDDAKIPRDFFHENFKMYYGPSIEYDFFVKKFSKKIIEKFIGELNPKVSNTVLNSMNDIIKKSTKMLIALPDVRNV